MTTQGESQTTPTTRGTKPEWLNLPRRKCDNCGKSYKPKRPNSRFHNDACKTSFHQHGGAYAKLLPKIQKEIARQMQLEEKCKACRGKGRVRNQPCQCDQGMQLTPYGRHVINLLERHLPRLVQWEELKGRLLQREPAAKL